MVSLLCSFGAAAGLQRRDFEPIEKLLNFQVTSFASPKIESAGQMMMPSDQVLGEIGAGYPQHVAKKNC